MGGKRLLIRRCVDLFRGWFLLKTCSLLDRGQHTGGRDAHAAADYDRRLKAKPSAEVHRLMYYQHQDAEAKHNHSPNQPVDHPADNGLVAFSLIDLLLRLDRG